MFLFVTIHIYVYMIHDGFRFVWVSILGPFLKPSLETKGKVSYYICSPLLFRWSLDYLKCFGEPFPDVGKAAPTNLPFFKESRKHRDACFTLGSWKIDLL